MSMAIEHRVTLLDFYYKQFSFMNNKKIFIAATVLLAILSIGCGSSSDRKEISSLINGFYGKGRPGDYRYVNKLQLTSGLAQLITKAAEKQTADSARLKAIGSTDKPLMIEGDIFTSVLEGNTFQEIKDLTIGKQESKVVVEFLNNSFGQLKWTDSILLVKEAGAWKIDDVLYTKGKGSGKGTRDVLTAFLQLSTDTSSIKVPTTADKDVIRVGQHAISLQWLGWEKRGSAMITSNGDGTYGISGQQNGESKDEYLTISGTLKPVSPSDLTFEGKITTRVPVLNKGQECVREGKYTFQVQPGKKYWRLQQMTNCEGGMTKDYIDIYFD